MREEKITLNFIQANVEQVHGQTVGTMVAIIDGTEENQVRGKQYLIDKGINVEEIGYVHV